MALLLVGGDLAAQQQTPSRQGGAARLSTVPADEVSPRLHLGPGGEVLRLWHRKTEFRDGGGAVFVAAAAPQNAWKPILEIAPKEAGVVTLTPDIAVGASGEMAVTYQWRRHLPRSKQIRLARSFDGGKTWLQSDTSVDTAGTAFAPKAAWGKGRNLVLVWADERRQERVWDIYARRSTDGGATWGPEQVLSRFPEQLGSDIYFRPEVVADGQNTFWAVWVGLRSGRSKLYLSRSTDGGQTWADPKELSGASQSVFGHRVVRAGERLLVVWQDTIIGGQDRLYSTSSSDGGATWTAPTRVDHLPTDMATGAVGPSMVMNEAGEALVAWHDGRNGRDDIFVGRSADGGRTWQAETRLDTDEPGTAFSRFTAMAAAGDGRIAVAWGDDRDGFEGVYLRIRSAGANPTWGPEVVVAGPSGKKGARTPGLLWAKDGSLFVTWEVWDYTFGPQAVTKRVDGRQIAPDKK